MSSNVVILILVCMSCVCLSAAAIGGGYWWWRKQPARSDLVDLIPEGLWEAEAVYDTPLTLEGILKGFLLLGTGVPGVDYMYPQIMLVQRGGKINIEKLKPRAVLASVEFKNSKLLIRPTNNTKELSFKLVTTLDTLKRSSEGEKITSVQENIQKDVLELEEFKIEYL